MHSIATEGTILAPPIILATNKIHPSTPIHPSIPYQHYTIVLTSYTTPWLHQKQINTNF